MKAIQQHHLVALIRREHAGFAYAIDFLILELSRHYDKVAMVRKFNKSIQEGVSRLAEIILFDIAEDEISHA